MISLIIPPKSQISQFSKMLADEYGTASNIKSRVNRLATVSTCDFYYILIKATYSLSVLGAITSVQQRLKLYNRGL
jgi:peptide chain release factor subunit 1